MNALLGDTFSHENNTHGSRLHDRDPQFASRILGTMTQSCYVGTRDIRSRVIRGPYCTVLLSGFQSSSGQYLVNFTGLAGIVNATVYTTGLIFTGLEHGTLMSQFLTLQMLAQ